MGETDTDNEDNVGSAVIEPGEQRNELGLSVGTDIQAVKSGEATEKHPLGCISFPSCNTSQIRIIEGILPILLSP